MVMKKFAIMIIITTFLIAFAPITSSFDFPTTAPTNNVFVFNGSELTFLNLSDTPSSYISQAGKCTAVNGGETGLEFIDCADSLWDLSGNNLTPSIAGRNLDISGGNVTADFFFGDGSQLTGINFPILNSTAWNRSGINVFLANILDLVGIGTSTPQRILHVNGSILSNATINATGDICIEGGVCLSTVSAGGGVINGAGTSGFITRWNASFQINNSVIFQNGNNFIGIATTNPQNPLNVIGSGNFTGNTTSQVDFCIEGTVCLSAVSGGGGAGSITGAGTFGFIPLWNGSFEINNSAIFQNNTFIGIGTTNPNATLEIESTTQQLQLTHSPGDQTIIETDSTGRLQLFPSNRNATLNGGLIIIENTYQFIDMRRDIPNSLSVLKIYSTGDFTNTFFETQGQPWLNYFRTNKVLIINLDDVESTIVDNDGKSVVDGIITPHTTMYPGDTTATSNINVSIDFWTERATSGFETPRARITSGNETGSRAGFLLFETSGDAVGFSDMNEALYINQFGDSGFMTRDPQNTVNINGTFNVTGNSFFGGNITTPNGGILWDNSTCTFLSSPDGSTRFEVCDA